MAEDTPKQRRSHVVTQGTSRAPNRAMLRAMGYTDEDFNKPIVGIANGYSTITPCNMGLNDLAKRAEGALEAGGAKSQMFGTADAPSRVLHSSNAQPTRKSTGLPRAGGP